MARQVHNWRSKSSVG